MRLDYKDPETGRTESLQNVAYFELGTEATRVEFATGGSMTIDTTAIHGGEA